MAHITTLTRAYNDLHNSQANTYSYSGSFETFKESEVKVKLNDTLLTYNSSPSDATQYSVNLTDKTIHVGGGNLTSGTLSIYPETDLGAPTLKAPYTAGSAITANDLTNNQKQTLRKLMEHEETKLDNTGGTMTGDLTMGEDRNIIFEGATDDAHETTITVADPTADRTITFPNVSGNVVTTGDTGTVTSTMLTNDTIVNADVNSSAAIAGTKISPDFGGQNIVTTGAATIGSTLAVTGAVDLNGGANIDNIQIGVTDDNEIDTASGNLTIDSAGGTVTIDDALTVSGGTSLNSTLGVTGTTTLSNVTGTAVVTSGTSSSDTKIYSAKRSDELYYRKGTADDIEESGVPWSGNDSTVATTAAIDARIVDLVEEVGGFVPIANELSFPNANPDINNGAGTLVSIKSLSQNLTSSGSGEITISNGTVGNSTVTITGADNNTTYAATYGLIVETTTILNTYTFHRLTPKATEITSVSGNATNINTVATNITNVNNVGNNIANVNTVAGDATEINALAAKTTELGLLGTAAVVEDLGILGTADVVSDLNTLGTADVVADMNLLAVSDVISDMNTLAVTDVINDMDTVATNVTNVNNVGGSIASVNTAAANLTSIANFGDQYQVAANNPSTDGGGNALAAGDLYFNTSANELKVYNGSAWQGGVTASGSFAAVTGNTFTGDNRYNDNVKALFGTGSDLEIYHTGSGSVINDAGQGNLHLRTGGSERITVGANSVGLAYDGTTKFETTSEGIKVTTDIQIEGGSGDTELKLKRTNTAGSNGNAFGSIKFIDENNNDIARISTIRSTAADDGDIRFETRPTGGSLTERLRINSDGHVDVIGNLDVGAGVDVTGNITVTGTVDGVDIAAFKTSFDNLSTDIVNDTSPQLGAQLDSNGYDIKLTDGEQLLLWNHGKLTTKTGATNAVVSGLTGYVLQNSTILDSDSHDLWLSSTGKKITFGTSDSLTHEVMRVQCAATGASQHGFVNLNYVTANYGQNASSATKLATTATGVTVTGTVAATSYTGDGSSLTGINTDLVGDTSPQLGADLDVNDFNIKNGNTVYEIVSNTRHKFDCAGSTVMNINGGGVDFSVGHITHVDSMEVRFGTGNDLKIYHDGSDSYINNTGVGNLIIRGDDVHIQGANGDNMGNFTEDGAVFLRYDGTTKFETTGTGAAITGKLSITDDFSAGDNCVIRLGAATGGDLQIYHDGSGSSILNGVSSGQLTIASDNALNLCSRTDTEYFFRGYTNGAAELYHNNSKRLETTTTGWKSQKAGSAECIIGSTDGDGAYLYLDGDANGDASGSDYAYIGMTNQGVLRIWNHKNEDIEFANNNGVRAKINTSGHFIPGANNTYDLGTSSYRWRNVYTNDLHLSNEGSSNDVDGSWGDWTIQEGESDLFLKNNRSGKKFKFNLTEVS